MDVWYVWILMFYFLILRINGYFIFCILGSNIVIFLGRRRGGGRDRIEGVRKKGREGGKRRGGGGVRKGG